MKSKVLANYLANKCTVEEAKIVEDWLKEDSNNRKIMKEFEQIWSISPHFRRDDESFDAELDWAVLQSRIDEESGYTKNLRLTKSASVHRLNKWALAQVAAIFIVAILVGVYTNHLLITEEPNIAPTIKEISMAKGQRGTVTLSDGTKVTLNAESSISLPVVFGADIRKVYLEGEAYFDVAKNPDKPFIIHTNGTIVEVLGTAFTIRSFPEDEVVRTVVEEGVVYFRGDSESTDNGVILTAGKLGAFDKSNKSIKSEDVQNLETYFEWKDGYLSFQNEKMENVKLALERKYDIQVVFNSPDLKELKLTAHFKSRMLKNVLETISMSLELQYDIDDDVIYFSKNIN